ncbi:MAG: hypothetical protein M3Q10_18495 [Chloroflexota bacterium]|nr:hypothetical protein [Chloroflexota bacterium]
MVEEGAEGEDDGRDEGGEHARAENAGENIGREAGDGQLEDDHRFEGGHGGEEREEDHRRQIEPARLRVGGEGGAGKQMGVPAGDVEIPQAVAHEGVPRQEEG